MTQSPADRLTVVEDAVASLAEGIGAFKPLPLGQHPALRAILENATVRNGSNETRPYTLPDHRQIVGRVA
jgi:hypothetical protein